MKPIKGAQKFSDKPMPQRHRLAMGLPVNQPVRKGPKTPA